MFSTCIKCTMLHTALSTMLRQISLSHENLQKKKTSVDSKINVTTALYILRVPLLTYTMIYARYINNAIILAYQIITITGMTTDYR